MSTPMSTPMSVFEPGSRHHHARWGLAQICLAGALWGTGGLGVQLIREQEPVSAVTISAWRMLLAALVLVAVTLAVRRFETVRALLRDHPLRAVTVGTGTAVYQVCYFVSVVAAGVSVATVVSLGWAPVVLTVVDAVRGRRWPGAGRLLVLSTALTGLLMVSATAGAGATGPSPTLGVVLALGSGTAYAVATELGRPLAVTAGPLALTTVTTTVGTVLVVPFGLLASLGEDRLVTTDPVAAAGLLYLGVVTMALAYGLLYAGLRTTTGSSAVIATLVEPVTAAFAAALVLDERLGVLGVLGTLLILAAVAGLGADDTPTPAPVPT